MNTLLKMSLLHYALPHRQVLKMWVSELKLLVIYIHCPDFVHVIIGVQDLQLKILYILLRLTNAILVWWTYRRKWALKMQCSRKQKRRVVPHSHSTVQCDVRSGWSVGWLDTKECFPAVWKHSQKTVCQCCLQVFTSPWEYKYTSCCVVTEFVVLL